MKRVLLITLTLMIGFATTTLAQDEVDFSLNAGWSAAASQYPALDAFKKQFDNETGFSHGVMTLDGYSTGGLLSASIYAGRAFIDFEYRALGTKATFNMVKQPGETQSKRTMKLYQHTGRYSYSYGCTFGKRRKSGLYLGAAIYAGTWDMKLKESGRKFNRTNVEDFKRFTVGISPQLTFRCHFVSLKMFYDYAFTKTDLAPLYNNLFHNAGAANTSGAAALKSGLNNVGACLTVVIPIGGGGSRRASSAKPAYSSPALPVIEAPKQQKDNGPSMKEIYRNLDKEERRIQGR